ncbi:uncharacterized protein LOC130052638 [Ostrea edulis]|nr:uncharacterized protein LOC130052638 [Ostrea edulis]
MALNKLAESSSVYNGDFHAHSPLKMTDGERTDKNLHCAATKMETQPWFRVDLQNVHQVDHVVVYTGWSNGEPCNAYQVRVGVTTSWSEMTSCGEGSQAKDETIVCKDCLLGRYVQLQMKSVDASCHIVTCELEVIATVV